MSSFFNKSNTWPLSWVSHDALSKLVGDLIIEGTPETRTLNHKNIVDPFSALFDMAISKMTYDEWENAEIRRQHQKTLQNAIGKFHQSVIGLVDGWEDLGVGAVVDVINKEKKIAAEIKNKFNTVKASDAINIHSTLCGWRTMSVDHRDFTTYYVQILTKERFNRPFTPPDHTRGVKPAPNEFVREIDGVSFYHLVTGDPMAMAKLYDVLPYILQEHCPSFDAEAATQHALFSSLINKAMK